MSKRFAAFLLLIWCPLMFIGGPALGNLYLTEFQSLSTTGQCAVIYVFLLVAWVPMLYVAFFPKSK